MTRVIAPRRSEVPPPPGRRSARRAGWAAPVVALLVSSASAPSRADTFDLTLNRLVDKPTMPGQFADPSGDTPALSAYRTFVSELGTALAPSFLTPSDTVGYNGFQFDVDYNFTTINNRKCQAGDTKEKCPWQLAVAGGLDDNGNARQPPGMVHTLSVMARKGIWLPLPSFEIGAGATKLLQSNIYAVQVYGKLALHEGFHGWPIPSLAVRGSGLRVVGESQLDLTMAQIDAMLSKSFGIAGTVTLVPYLGAAWLYIIPRGQVLDLTPAIDAYKQGPSSLDLNNNAVFPSEANANITRWRFFGGMRLNYNVLVLTADFIATTCGDFNGGCKDDRHKNVTVPDNSSTQYTVSVSGGFLF